MDIDQEKDFGQVYPFLLLHAAQMHPLDLRRCLANWRGADGSVRVSLDQARSWRGYKYELLIQLAIECVLESEDFDRQMERDAAFRRLAYDAMYYPSRQWERGEPLILGDSNQADFETYLTKRMHSEDEESKTALDRVATANQRRMLFESVRRLARMLAEDRKTWCDEFFRRRNLTSGVMDAVPDLPLLKENPPHSYRFDWCFDRAGAELDDKGTSRQSPQQRNLKARPNWQQEEAFINATEKIVQEIGGKELTLQDAAENYRLIGTSPVYPEVRLALGRLNNALHTKAKYDFQDRDEDVVRDFAVLLRRDTNNLGAALLAAKALTMTAPSGHSTEGIHRALTVIRDVLQLDLLTSRGEEDRLRTICEGLHDYFPQLQSVWSLARLYETGDLKSWKEAMDRLSRVENKLSRNEQLTKKIIQSAWNAWRVRLMSDDFIHDKPGALAALLMCHFSNIGPARRLQPDPRRMTMCHWSKIFLEAVLGTPITDPCPRWLIWPAIHYLGWHMSPRDMIHLAERFSEMDEIIQEDAHDLDDVRRFSAIVAASAVPDSMTVLVLTRKTSKYFQSWPVSERIATLILEREDAEALAKYVEKNNLKREISNLLKCDLIVLEEPNDAKDVAAYTGLINQFAKIQDEKHVIGCLTENPERRDIDPVIRAPKDLEYLVAEADAILRQRLP